MRPAGVQSAVSDVQNVVGSVEDGSEDVLLSLALPHVVLY